MESVTRSFRQNPIADKLLEKFLREHPDKFESKSDIMRTAIEEFLEKQGMM